jgi:hypothetical protein
VAVVELDTSDTPPETAFVFEVTAAGEAALRLKAKVEPWGQYLRYKYASFDFSPIERPGLYFIEYGGRLALRARTASPRPQRRRLDGCR